MTAMSQQEQSGFESRFRSLRLIKPESIISQEKRADHKLSEVMVGGVIRLNDKTYRIVILDTYTEVNKSWKKKSKNPYTVTEMKLFCLKDGTTHYIEWSVDDELEISFTDRKIPKSELNGNLKYDNGEVVDLDDVDEICEEEEGLYFDGMSYCYDDDSDMIRESSNGKSDYVCLAEFGDEESGRWLTIEAWTDDPKDEESWDYEVWLSHDVDPAAIEILSLGGDDNA